MPKEYNFVHNSDFAHECFTGEAAEIQDIFCTENINNFISHINQRTPALKITPGFINIAKSFEQHIAPGFNLVDLYKNRCFPFKITTLHAALINANLDAVKFLLNNDANPTLTMYIHRYETTGVDFNNKIQYRPILEKFVENITCLVLALATNDQQIITEIFNKLSVQQAIEQIFSKTKINNYCYNHTCCVSYCDIEVNALDIALKLNNYRALKLFINCALNKQNSKILLTNWLFTKNMYQFKPITDRKIVEI
jgi:hypothetical protein